MLCKLYELQTPIILTQLQFNQIKQDTNKKSYRNKILKLKIDSFAKH